MNRHLLKGFLNAIAERGRSFLSHSHVRAVRNRDVGRLAEALLSGRGEASSMALAQEILTVYAAFAPEEKLVFLKLLAQRFGANEARLGRALENYQAKPTSGTAQEIHIAAEPRRQELFRRLNLAPGGTGALVHMREDVIGNLAAHPELGVVDADLIHLFSSWFNRGFLLLKRIDWSTPATVLEKILRYEAVHEINGWEDLRNRLEPVDRRCFAFFHPTLVDDPLIFVEVALTVGIPQAIGPVLAEKRKAINPTSATCAVFYSISNCHLGLRGISFGNFLIKQVVEELKSELPNLRDFVTLSPVPGFMAWLLREREARSSQFLTAEDTNALKHLDKPEWPRNADAVSALEQVLPRAVARYLLYAKNGGDKPIDPVARFHLGNGARLERVNWLGDLSAKGIAQAAGLMVNYFYDLREIERNHEIFANKGEVVASRLVRNLLRTKGRGKNAVCAKS